ncbi:MAG TPA: type VI secretion system-associated FHA domain protein TagH [Phenylobacterium sp.]
MYTLRLFHQADPSRQLEARDLDEGELAIGRDAGADWAISDPARTLSRQHCVVVLKDGAISLRDTSANGVYLGAERRRLAPQAQTLLSAGDTIQLGDFVIVVEEGHSFAPPPADDDSPFDAPFHRPILDDSAIGAESLAIPFDWADAPPAAAPPSDGSLLDAFCAGAKLDASAFAGEDPAVVMQRLGEVYRQMVLGLGDLMQERTSAKSGYRMERTRVHAEGNNPFKWAAPQRVAVDLLRGRETGFLTGPAAVTASFGDLKKHLLCMLAGMRAAIGATLDGLSPEAVEAALERQSYMLRAKVNWAEYVKLHGAFRQQAQGEPDSVLNRAFAQAYERRLDELDSLGELTQGPA